MSLTVMSNSEELLDVELFDPVFKEIDPVETNILTRTVIGELEGNKLARIKRVAELILREEVDHHKYSVELAVPHDAHDEIIVVYSSFWDVTPLAAAKNSVLAEVKSKEEFAVYHPRMQPALETPEDIFAWYDNVVENKGQVTVGSTAEVEPNIYTASGMEKLIRIAEFRQVEQDGEA